MSKPINKNHTLEGLMLFLILQSKWIASEKQRFLSNYCKPFEFKSGGIVAGKAHQGEAIVSRKGGVYRPLLTFSEQPKCKNILTKTQSNALDILKNINKLKK